MKELEELEMLLDEQLSTNSKEEEFDWESWINEAPEQEVDYNDYYDYNNYLDEDSGWNEYAEEERRKYQFLLTHGVEEDVYIDQCCELYNTIGNRSQRDYDNISDDFNKAYRVLDIQRKIDEGIDLGVDVYRMLEFCDTCLYPEERYEAIKYYINKPLNYNL